MFKKRNVKYIVTLIIISLVFILSSCNDNKKNYELYNSMIDELYEIENDINNAEFFENDYSYTVKDRKTKENKSRDYNYCIVKKDLSYIRQQRPRLAYKYYSLNDGDIYSIERKEKDLNYNDHYSAYSKYSEIDYNISKLENYSLKDIFGLYDVKKLKIDSFNGKNGKIIKHDYDRADYYTLEMKYSLLKDEPLIKEIIEIDNFSDIKPYITDDTNIILEYYLYKKQGFEFAFRCPTIIDGDEIDLYVRFDKSICSDGSYNIDFPQQTNINVEEEQSISLLPLGEKTLGFVPKYSGYYDINIDLSNPVTVTIDDEEYNGTNIKITKLLESKEKYYIKLKGNDAFSDGKALISYSVKMDNISIKENDVCVIKLEKFNGVKNLLVNNENIEIKAIKINSDVFNDDVYDYSHATWNKRNACILDGTNEFLLFLGNQTNKKIDDISITISDPEEIDLNSINEITIDGNSSFYKIDNKVAGQYRINILDGEINSIKLYGSDRLESIDVCYPRDIENKISMDGDKCYFIEFISYKKTKIKVEFQKNENEYEWEIKGDNGFYLKTHENTIRLKRGNNYHIDLLVNGIISELSTYPNVSDGFKFNKAEQTLFIEDTANLYNAIYFDVRYPDYYSSLRISPLFNESMIKCEINETNKNELEVLLPNRVLSFDYILKIGDKEFDCTYNNGDNYIYTSKAKIKLSDFVDNYINENIEIRIYNLKLYFGDKIVYPCDIKAQFFITE